jgi:predicted enzyme related to lactoylglutathione lyase
MNPFQQPGAFSWQELVTPEPEEASAFYQKLLGWTIEQDKTVGVPYNTIKTQSGQPIGGIMPPPPNSPALPATWGVYITVENVDETVEQAQTLGGKILMQPIDIPTVGRFALIADPQGARFAVITYLNR